MFGITKSLNHEVLAAILGGGKVVRSMRTHGALRFVTCMDKEAARRLILQGEWKVVSAGYNCHAVYAARYVEEDHKYESDQDAPSQYFFPYAWNAESQGEEQQAAEGEHKRKYVAVSQEDDEDTEYDPAKLQDKMDALSESPTALGPDSQLSSKREIVMYGLHEEMTHLQLAAIIGGGEVIRSIRKKDLRDVRRLSQCSRRIAHHQEREDPSEQRKLAMRRRFPGSLQVRSTRLRGRRPPQATVVLSLRNHPGSAGTGSQARRRTQESEERGADAGGQLQPRQLALLGIRGARAISRAGTATCTAADLHKKRAPRT